MSQDDGTNRLDFVYDAGGTMIGFKLNGTDCYYYLFNLQGDVTGIYDSDGVIVAKYYYDAWGNTTEMDGSGNSVYDENHVARLNPIRYRSYYYDSEILMYYLQSRYYMPMIYRFISADALFVAGDPVTAANMYAYCGNNPVMYIDPTGTDDDRIFHEAMIVIIFMGIAAKFAAKVFDAYETAEAIGQAVALAVEWGLSNATIITNKAKDFGYLIIKGLAENINIFTHKRDLGIFTGDNKYFDDFVAAINKYSKNLKYFFMEFFGSWFLSAGTGEGFGQNDDDPDFSVLEHFQWILMGAMDLINSTWNSLVITFGLL